MTIKYIVGTAWEEISKLDRGSVQLIVTSPPYANLKDYGHPKQIGWGQTYEEYQRALSGIWSDCAKVLDAGCRLAINVGDVFQRATKTDPYQVLPVAADTINACRSTDLLYLGSIIWHHVTTTRTSGGGKWMGSTYYPGGGMVTYEHEYILLFKKPGKRKPSSDSLVREASRLTRQQRSEWFRGIWTFPGARQGKTGHPAVFPEELPERLIRMFTYVGETVLDPFVGSGTTCQVAEKLGRNSIGVDLIPFWDKDIECRD